MPIRIDWESPLFWKTLARSAGLFAAFVGALVLYGWMMGIPALKSIWPGWVTMKVNTALCIVLAGFSLWLKADEGIQSHRLWRHITLALAVPVMVLGWLTILEYQTHLDLGLDQWLFSEPAAAVGTLAPGRMAPAAAVCFMLLGVALALGGKSTRTRSLAAMLAVAAGLLAFAAGLAYLYGIDNFYGFGMGMQMAAHTVLALILLAMGVLCAQPGHGVVALLRRRDSSGAITRRLLPVALLLPVLIGWLKVAGDHFGLYEPDFGVALVTLTYIVMLCALVFWSARFLARIDAERERASATLAMQDARLRTLVNTIPDFIWLKDVGGVYLACNPAFERFVGEDTKIVGKTDFDLLPREQADAARANDRLAITAGGPRTSAEWLPAPDGQPVLMETTKAPMFDQQGALIGVLGIARDITAHYRANEQLRAAKAETERLLAESNQAKLALQAALEDSTAAKARYVALFGSIADAVYVHEILEDGTLGKFLEVNEVACRLTGYAREELLGMTPYQLDAPDSGVEPKQVIQRLRDGASFSFEQVHLGKDGRRIPVEIHAQQLMLNGRPTVISIARDIMERKLAEQKLNRLNEELERRVQQRTAQLEDSNKELEAFSYSVSHDLRAPLRSIAGFIELLRKHNYASIDDKGRHYMDVISASAVQMGRLIEDILTFSRIGRTGMTMSRVRLDEVLAEVQDTLHSQIEGRSIEWKIGPLPEVDGERTMLSLVLLNLLSNALKFTQTRETAIIEIGQTESSQTENNGEIVCYVRDNGVGFDMQYANKLFGLFQRLHPQEQFEGTGVGLANVQRIIQRHGGRVWAESKVDEGATFYFALPKIGGDA
ncbi:MAG TPA: PAS domain S-box protein [Gallionella sp.]|nr:PAS domain S-box protein [Gallionella sp.]